MDIETGSPDEDDLPPPPPTPPPPGRFSLRTLPRLVVWVVAFWLVLISVVTLVHVMSSPPRDLHTLRLPTNMGGSAVAPRSVAFVSNPVANRPINITVEGAAQVVRFEACCRVETVLRCAPHVACLLYVRDGVASCMVAAMASASCVLYLE